MGFFFSNGKIDDVRDISRLELIQVEELQCHQMEVNIEDGKLIHRDDSNMSIYKIKFTYPFVDLMQERQRKVT